MFVTKNQTTSGTVTVEHTERPSTVDDIINREATTQIPLGETGKSRSAFMHSISQLIFIGIIYIA